MKLTKSQQALLTAGQVLAIFRNPGNMVIQVFYKVADNKGEWADQTMDVYSALYQSALKAHPNQLMMARLRPEDQ